LTLQKLDAIALHSRPEPLTIAENVVKYGQDSGGERDG
jgi:hypothetical protein